MLKKLPVQIVILLLIGIIVGVANNLVSPNKIPWVQEYINPADLQSDDSVWRPFSWDPSTDTVFELLSLREAYQKFVNKEGIFIDSRSQEEYVEGHIQGAVNIDFEYASDELFEEQLRQLEQTAGSDDLLMTYCSGAECDVSLQLARYLKGEGYTNISIFFGGWEFWTSNELPIESDIETGGVPE